MPARSESEWVTRFLPTRASKVDVADDKRLTGYAIIFNSLSHDLGGFRERILPTAVDRTIRTGDNVDALIDHRRETATILGSTDSGLLRLRKDRHGLGVEITPPDTAAARDLMVVVRSGLVKGMSFAFRVMPSGDQWDEEDGTLVRSVGDMQFSEVSVVVSPAYPATEIHARNAEIDKRALEAYNDLQLWKPSRAFRERQLRAGAR